jgi:hypothetical protein
MGSRDVSRLTGMNEQDNKRLEEWTDRELRALPDLEAPDGFLERVMDAVRQRATRRWWQCSWQGWPAGWQAAVLVGLLAVAGWVSYVGALAVEGAWGLGAALMLETWLEPLVAGLELLGTAWRAGLLVFRAWGQQVLMLGVILGVGLYALWIGLMTISARIRPVRLRQRLCL